MLASLVGALLSGEAAATAKRVKIQIIVTAIVGLLVLVGLMFLVLAGYLYAAQRLGAIHAALWIGGGLIAVALIAYLIFSVTAKMRAKRQARRRKAELSTVAAATLIAALPALATRRGGLGILAAPIVAALGYQIFKENTRGPRRRRGDEPLDD